MDLDEMILRFFRNDIGWILIMDEDGEILYEDAKAAAFDLGVSKGIDPFMTLSFMALPVIPTLRLTTRGVFDVTNQRYV